MTKRFVCAHELGHSQLHTRVNTPFLRSTTYLPVSKIEGRSKHLCCRASSAR
ncbi:hypothetical protein [Clostridium sp. 1xD42-85]|uniref:ImmA/IrrE family metallo-endopeptidase n=1 Tax=Clostridium sp. 1xD42-85 TaxID=2320084 RepID=UPI00256FCD28|nr:hypothetical protein [Clostridium sp. 1xD42-85]